MKTTAIVLGILAAAIGLVILQGIPVYLLWNMLMPELFGLKAITFGQAICISGLSATLFRSNSTCKCSKS